MALKVVFFINIVFIKKNTLKAYSDIYFIAKISLLSNDSVSKSHSKNNKMDKKDLLTVQMQYLNHDYLFKTYVHFTNFQVTQITFSQHGFNNFKNNNFYVFVILIVFTFYHQTFPYE